MKAVQFRLRKEDYERLVRLAENQSRSVASLLRYWVKKHLEMGQ